MNKRGFLLISIVLILILTVILLSSCSSSGTTTPESSALNSASSASAGQALMQDRCSMCHSIERVTSAQKTTDEWKATVDRMIEHGVQLTPQEEQTLVDYLAQNYK